MSGGTVAGLVAFGISLYFIYLVLFDEFRLDLGNYEKIEGIVLDSSVKGSTGPTAGGSRSRITYVPVIKYSYKVNGKKYFGNSRESESISKPSSDRVVVGEIANKYPKGESIDIWYNLDKHEISVVNIEGRKTLSKLLTIFLFFLVGVFFIWSDHWVAKMRAEKNEKSH